MSFTMFHVTLLLCAVLTTWSMHIRPMKEGLDVHKHGKIHMEGGRWRVVMAMEQPTYPDVQKLVAVVRGFILDLPTELGAVTFARWLSHLTRIDQASAKIIGAGDPLLHRRRRHQNAAVRRPRSLLPFLGTWTKCVLYYNRRHHLNTTDHRPRSMLPFLGEWTKCVLRHRRRRDLNTAVRHPRSLLPFLGEWANALVGTATDAQVAELRSAIEETRSKQVEILHFNEDMITVVNTTKQIAAANREEILLLTTKLEGYFDGLVTNLSREVSTLRTILTVNQAIHEVESQYQFLLRQHDRYIRLRQSLESGRVTEELLPPHLLVQINKESGLELMTPNEWYYENVILTTVWDNPPFYVAFLPLIQPGSWLLYQFNAYPVPADDEKHTVTLIVDNLALDTVSGLAIGLSDKCLGHPMLCPAGPRWKETRCAATLIKASTQSPLDSCSATIEQRGDRPIVVSTGLNSVALTTWGKTLIEHCPGQSPVVHTLPKGTYMLSINGTCGLAGKDWDLKGIHLWQSQLVLPTEDFIIPPNLNLSDIQSYVDFNKFHYSTSATDGNMANSRMPRLVVPLKNPTWTQVGSGYYYLFFLLLILVILMVALALWHFKLCKFNFKTGPLFEPTIEPTPHQGVDNVGLEPLYPQLRFSRTNEVANKEDTITPL